MDQLGINLPGLIAQLINFGLLFVILRAVLWPNIIKMLDARSERIRQSLEQATQLQQQAAQTQAQFDEQLAQARKEAQDIVARALQSSERIKAEAETDAQKQAEAILTRARSEIGQERDRAIADLRREFAGITVQAAERVIGQSLADDSGRHTRIIDDVLASSPTFRGA